LGLDTLSLAQGIYKRVFFSTIILKLSESESKVRVFQAIFFQTILFARVTSQVDRFPKDLLLVPGLPWYFREAVLGPSSAQKERGVISLAA
jgi:hypothetical protein